MTNSQWKPNGGLHTPKTWWKPRYTDRPSPGIFKHENEEYWCETCDRGFSSVYFLEQHKRQHQVIPSHFNLNHQHFG